LHKSLSASIVKLPNLFTEVNNSGMNESDLRFVALWAKYLFIAHPAFAEFADTGVLCQFYLRLLV
jgi:hypothetical protein